jgi:hypothetical protein
MARGPTLRRAPPFPTFAGGIAPPGHTLTDRRMSIGFLRFLGVLLILGSIGFATVKGSITGGFRYLTPGFGQVSHVPTADHR